MAPPWRTAEASALAAAVKQSPGDGKGWMKLATLARRERNTALAERILLASVRAQPANALLWQALADTLHESGQYAQARVVYRKTLEVNASLGSAYHAWGRMEASLGNTDAARRLYQAGLERGLPRPNPRLVHGLSVLLAGQLRQTAVARRVLQVGLRHEPANPQLLHAIGLLEANAGNVDAARHHLRKAVAIATPRALPASAQGWQHDEQRAAQHHPAGERPEAQTAAAAERKRSAPFWQAAHALARLEESVGNVEVAKEVAMRGVEATAGAVQLWQLWANIEENRGRVDAARRVYWRATAQHRSDVQLWEQWARLEEWAGEVEAACELYETAIAVQPAHADAYARYAALLLRDADASGPRSTWGARGRAHRESAVAKARELYRRGVRRCALPREGRSGSAAHSRRLCRLLYDWAVLEWKNDDRVQSRVLFERALSIAQRDQLAWVLQLYARFEADCGNLAVARHLIARAVNADRIDGSAWRFWAELEEKAEEYALAQQLQANGAFQDVRHTLLFRQGGIGGGDELGYRMGGPDSGAPR